ncbi:hypothetical protein OK074_7204 [Actinobacteria bacterium OK074]|nr:hypothetical protein OK074_7204 [Actinobacteria bacterium OK074]
MWRRRESRENTVAATTEAHEVLGSLRCRMPVLPVSGPGHGATRLQGSPMILPGFHLEHPTAGEGCRSASQGLTLTLDAVVIVRSGAVERQCRTAKSST